MPVASNEIKDAYDPKIIWNVPNALTMLRILLVPVFAVLYMKGLRMAALAVYGVAALTDLADGFIARKYGMITDFGKLMDPLADKLMTITMGICMVLKGDVPAAIVIILAAKEVLMVIGGLFLLKKGSVAYSRWIGKLAQATVVSGFLLAFFSDRLRSIGAADLHIIILWIGVGLTLCALGYYAVGMVQALRKKDESEAVEERWGQ